jgi:hypothetical protein
MKKEKEEDYNEDKENTSTWCLRSEKDTGR